MGMHKFLPALLLTLLLCNGASCALASDIQIRPDQNAAVLRSVPPGSTIRLMPGRYTQPLHFIELRGTPQAPIRITAESGAVIDGRTDKSIAKGSGLLLEKSSNVMVEGLTIAGFERGVSIGACQMVTLKGNTIHDISNYGVMSYMSDGTTIVENTIERSSVEHGVYISGNGSKITVANNTIRDTHINGIHINGVVVAPVVKGNILERTGSFPTKEGGAGLTLVGGTSAPVVEGNTFKNIYGQGITMDAPNAVISNNTFVSCAWSAILGLAGSKNLRLSGNAFQESKVIPLQLAASILPSLTASGDHFAANGPVLQDKDSNKTYSLKDWQGMGKDVH